MAGAGATSRPPENSIDPAIRQWADFTWLSSMCHPWRGFLALSNQFPTASAVGFVVTSLRDSQEPWISRLLAVLLCFVLFCSFLFCFLVHSAAFVVHSARGRRPASPSPERVSQRAKVPLGQDIPRGNLCYRFEPPVVRRGLTFTNTWLSALDA
jgi:hypothetical protein